MAAPVLGLIAAGLIAAVAGGATGAVSYRACISSNSDVAGCTKIGGASAGGTDTGLDFLRSLAASADGRSVYTASAGGDALARFNRNPNTGALTYAGCTSSDSDVAGCTQIPGATADGTYTGLDSLQSVAVSADGRGVFTASGNTQALAYFDRNPSTGAVTYAGCITANTNVAGCTQIPGANGTGTGVGLSGLREVAVSADGESIYATAGNDSALTRFGRNPKTGAVAYGGCISSDSDLTGCIHTPGATSGAANTGLHSPFAIALSPDDESVYVASLTGDALVRFDRDPSVIGVGVTYASCITSNSGDADCTPIPGATVNGNDTGLNTLEGVAVTADGKSIYTTSQFDAALARFDRNPNSGAVTYQGCITSDSNVTGCTKIPGASADGTDTPLAGLRGLALSADGESVYASTSSSDALNLFNRNLNTGAVSFAGCTSSNSNVAGCTKIAGASANGTNTGLDTLTSIAISADGRNVYGAAQTGDALARFDRERPSNLLRFGKTKRNRKRGTATLRVKVPGRGELVLGGNGVKPVVRTLDQAATVPILVAAKGRTAKRLRKRGRVVVRAKLTFTPVGNDPRTVTRKLKLIRRH